MSLFYTSERNVQIVIALLKANNIRKVVASPGTTNITFIGSIMHDPFFEIYSSVDERSAAYIACGLSEESGEPVVISCTGATASRNYFSGLTEAYYRKLPILAITSTQAESNIGHLRAQVIDRSAQPKDTVKCSVHLQTINDADDEWDCIVKANYAIGELDHHGRGPVHINLTTTYSRDFSVEKIPEVRRIKRLYHNSSLPDVKNGRVAIYVGSHLPFSDDLTKFIDDFCKCYNAVVFCEPTSNYFGAYRVAIGLATAQYIYENLFDTDLLIHIGEVSDFTKKLFRTKEVWRVSEDGKFVDHFRKLTYVFEMSESTFFSLYCRDDKQGDDSYLGSCKEHFSLLESQIPELPFSNIWIASVLYKKMPENSELHLGILNSLRAWSLFDATPLRIFCNQGGFGIDGNMSAMIGASLVNSEKLYYLVLGDLAFFYDLNVLGNRHVSNNVRILLVNNGKGSEFHLRGNPGSMFLPETERFISAGGHYTNKSKDIVKNIAAGWGYKYMKAENKEEFLNMLPLFLSPINSTNEPIIFEVYTTTENEDAAFHLMRSIDKIEKTSYMKMKDKIKTVIGEKASNFISGIKK